ncbi:MAG: hypothetical protein WAO08_18165 [Hyphomicrobiaceae bacterium]
MIRFAILLALIATTATAAQQATFYDARTGKAVARSITGSDGTITTFGADGRAISRETRDGTI